MKRRQVTGSIAALATARAGAVQRREKKRIRGYRRAENLRNKKAKGKKSESGRSDYMIFHMEGKLNL